MNRTSKAKSYEMDMCNGPLFGKILIFSLPLMLSGILQLLFNAADIIVVGKFAGNRSLAAVGSTGSITLLLINVFIGISVGANALIARYYGAGQERNVSRTIHTAILLSLISGILLCVAGIMLARPLLRLMATPDDVLEKAVLYMRIYFLGMPATLLYNFGSSILRAVGDTKRPLYYLSVAGVANILMNMLFVIVFHMDVAGVALATILSQCISALCVAGCLLKSEGCCKLHLKELHIYKEQLLGMMRIGIPAGVQGALLSISNVILQSSINSFGSDVMAGHAAAGNVEGFVYTAQNTMHQTAVSFVSQNLGGRKYDRIKKTLLQCLAVVTVVGLVLGNGVAVFGKYILRLYSTDAHVIGYGAARLWVTCPAYCLSGIMETIVGAIRGLGYSVMPTIVSLIGICGLRVVWVFTVFQWHRSHTTLFVSYPVSWALTAFIQLICYLVVLRRTKEKLGYHGNR